MGLWQLVQAELGEKGFRIASDCKFLVRTLVEAGEANLLKQPDRRTLAGSNLTLLANQMMVNAGKRGSHMVEEQDFYDARNQWCPLWPFCSSKALDTRVPNRGDETATHVQTTPYRRR